MTTTELLLKAEIMQETANILESLFKEIEEEEERLQTLEDEINKLQKRLEGLQTSDPECFTPAHEDEIADIKTKLRWRTDDLSRITLNIAAKRAIADKLFKI